MHRCSELNIDKKAVLEAGLSDLGFRRFRLMSYWNIHEPAKGSYNFDELDWQLEMVAKYNGTVSLCLGKRQPRWPECHMPQWASVLSKSEWYQALYEYIKVVVLRYKDHPALKSWQLENEALLKNFGYCPDQDYSRKRLQEEYIQVKSTDPNHPVIMTLSDSWGLPWRRPYPDQYAMSLYRITINKRGSYAYSRRPPYFYKLRADLIKILRRKPLFIHELQAEPWLAKSITQTSVDEQLERMSARQIQENISFALGTGLRPIDLWGLEWWYWLRETQGNSDAWEAVKKVMQA